MDECDKGSECQANYCCISNVQPIGKRGISARKNGYCAPMPGAEESCLYRENSFGTNYLDGLSFQCPCKSGLECVKNPNGYYIVPIGYQGTCKSN